MDNYQFFEFLDTVEAGNREFVMEINDFLLEFPCKCEIKTAKSGFTVSYILNQTKKTLATFVCRKTGVKLRIYPQHINQYEEFLNTLPEKMKKDIKRTSICKRLVNPADCNPKCVMGYDFVLDEERFQKCRYMAFMPSVNKENTPFLKSFLEKEISFQ